MLRSKNTLGKGEELRRNPRMGTKGGAPFLYLVGLGFIISNVMWVGFVILLLFIGFVMQRAQPNNKSVHVISYFCDNV